MSKKLLAIAAAAALSVSAFALPAQASTFTIKLDDATNTGLVATEAKKHAAPEQNKLVDTSAANATNTVVRIDLQPTAAVAYTVTTTGGVKVITTLTDKKVADGVESLTGTFVVGADVTFYAYSTSTAVGTVVVNSGGNQATRYIAANPGTAYNVSAVFPSFIAEGGSGDILATVTDVFGNTIIGGGTAQNDTAKNSTNSNAFTATSSRLTVSAVGVTVTNPTNWTWDAIKSAWKHTVTAAVAGNVAIRLSLETDDYSTTSGFAKPVLSAFTSLNAADAETQIAALTAQVAALQAQIADMRTKANSVTKKRWNNLVLRHRALGGSAKLK